MNSADLTEGANLRASVGRFLAACTLSLALLCMLALSVASSSAAPLEAKALQNGR